MENVADLVLTNELGMVLRMRGTMRRAGRILTIALATLEIAPEESVHVIVAIYSPALAYVCEIWEVGCGPVAVDPSPGVNVKLDTVPLSSTSKERLPSNVIGCPCLTVVGIALRIATGSALATLTVISEDHGEMFRLSSLTLARADSPDAAFA